MYIRNLSTATLVVELKLEIAIVHHYLIETDNTRHVTEPKVILCTIKCPQESGAGEVRSTTSHSVG